MIDQKKIRINLFLLIIFLCFGLSLIYAGDTGKVVTEETVSVPGKEWFQYASPGEAGFSAEKLERAGEYFNTIDAAAVMVIYRGVVLAAWGDIERRYWCHSVRKSFMNALYGIYVEKGLIDLSKTLKELNIDDVSPLTETEKGARIMDLLRSRSGVYHEAAAETSSMKRTRPKRGSHKPGTYWYYNNWDFNALCTIFEKETGKKLFAEFKKQVADPLQMEDFRLFDTYYHFERQYSLHPACAFRMSTRDMARFGLLFLHKGKWREKQVVPGKWVEKSTRAYSSTFWRRGDYGYLWWVDRRSRFKELGMFSARGAGGHRIDILPGADLVFVLRPNTYERKRVDDTKGLQLLVMILDARVSQPKAAPKLLPLPGQAKRINTIQLDSSTLNKYANQYKLDSGFWAFITNKNDELWIYFPEIGNYKLLPVSKTKFILEDFEIPIFFKLDNDGNPTAISIHFSSKTIETGSLVRSR